MNLKIYEKFSVGLLMGAKSKFGQKIEVFGMCLPAKRKARPLKNNEIADVFYLLMCIA